jgi:hypothetical protein
MCVKKTIMITLDLDHAITLSIINNKTTKCVYYVTNNNNAPMEPGIRQVDAVTEFFHIKVN